MEWNKAAGETIEGLTRRRAAELNFFKTPVVATDDSQVLLA